jgi:hypothetical protein
MGLVLCLPVVGTSAQTRPLQTEQAETAPAGRVVLEAGGQVIGSEPNFLTGGTRTRWEAPGLRLVYSPADNVEMDLEWTVRVGVHDDPTFGSLADYGDVALRAKLRLAGGGPERCAFGARFSVTLPQTSFTDIHGTALGLGPDTLRFGVQALLSVPLEPAWIHLNAGLALLDEPLRAHEQRDLFAYGLGWEYPYRAWLTLVAEAAGLAGDGEPGADARFELRAGFRAGRGRVRWDAAVRRGLAAADGDWGLTAGLTWMLR